MPAGYASTMTFGVYTKQIPDELVGAIRTGLIVTSIVGIVLGIIAVVWPHISVLVLGVLFGISLIVTGIFRIYQAFAASFVSAGWRVLLGILGLLILVLGIMALISPEDAIWLLALFIGVGWIFQGVADLYAAMTKSGHSPVWFLVFAGVVSVLAGIVMIVAGQLALTAFVWVAGILLIVLSVVTLFTLPKKVDATA